MASSPIVLVRTLKDYKTKPAIVCLFKPKIKNYNHQLGFLSLLCSFEIFVSFNLSGMPVN